MCPGPARARRGDEAPGVAGTNAPILRFRGFDPPAKNYRRGLVPATGLYDDQAIGCYCTAPDAATSRRETRCPSTPSPPTPPFGSDGGPDRRRRQRRDLTTGARPHPAGNDRAGRRNATPAARAVGRDRTAHLPVAADPPGLSGRRLLSLPP